MSVLTQLASAQGRRDDVPNQELAKQLTEAQDREGIRVLVENLAHEDPNVQSDCIKTLYEVGYLDPTLITNHWVVFLELLASKNNRLIWGGMIALSTLADLRAPDLFEHKSEIQQAMEGGSVITQDSGVRVLTAVAAQREEYRTDLLPYLLKKLTACRAKDLPKYAEMVFNALGEADREKFREVLTLRIPELTPSQQRRMERTLKKLNEPFHRK
jgi:hypothetical protein